MRSIIPLLNKNSRRHGNLIDALLRAKSGLYGELTGKIGI